MDKISFDGSEGLWQHILANPKSHIEIKDESHILALGYPDVGKSSIIRALQELGSNEALNEDELYRNTDGISGIDNGYINIRRIDDNDDLPSADVEAQMNLWILQSPAYKNFLKTRLKAEYLHKMAIVIFLDLSNPWNLIKHLNDWMDVGDEIIEDLVSQLDLDSQDELKEKHQSYVKNYKMMAFHMFNAASKSAFITDDNLQKPTKNHEEDFYNLGVPIIVVICKSDAYSSLDAGKVPDQIDVITAHLRKACLNRASAIIFCSITNSKAENILVLYQYLAHRLYGFPFMVQTTMEPYTSYFLPSGWDNYQDLQDFVAKTSIENFSLPFEMIISKPTSNTTIDKPENNKLKAPLTEDFLSDLLKENPNYGLGENFGFNSKQQSAINMDASGMTEETPKIEKTRKSSISLQNSRSIEDLHKKKDKPTASPPSFFENLKTKIQKAPITTSEKSKREKPTVLKESTPE